MITLSDENYQQCIRVAVFRALDLRPGGITREQITKLFFLEFGLDADIEYLDAWLEHMFAHNILGINYLNKKIYRRRVPGEMDRFVETVDVTKGGYL